MMNFFSDVYHVAWGDMRFMKHNFHNIVISSLVTPILYLLAFGYMGMLAVGVNVRVRYSRSSA